MSRKKHMRQVYIQSLDFLTNRKLIGKDLKIIMFFEV